MAIPDQVQKDVAKVEEFMKTQGNPGEGVTTQQAQGSNAPDGAVPVASTAATLPGQTAPTATPATVVPVSEIHQGKEGVVIPQQQPDESPEMKLLRQQHSTLQGMFNSERARHKETQNTMGSQIAELRTAITNLQPQAPQLQVSQPVSQEAVLFTEDEAKEYSPGFVSMMTRVIDQKLAPVYSGLNQVSQVPQAALGQMNERMDQVAQSQEQLALQSFFGNLTKAVPDWEAVNADPRFNLWLQEIDPISNISTQVFLDDARNRLELDRVVSVFNAFKQVPPTAGTVTNAQVASTSALEQAVVPTSITAAAPQDQAGQIKTFTRADLTKLYADELAGVYKGKEDVFRERERELLQAINTGHYT